MPQLQLLSQPGETLWSVEIPASLITIVNKYCSPI